jgi:L-fuculose-phosphate aldolase
MYDVSAVLFHDEQATYFDDGRKSHLEVVDALGDKRVVLMKNHGAIIASDSVEHATIEALTLERCAHLHLDCVAAGGTEILEEEVVAGKAMYRKHYLPQMWDANLARLQRSDPDVFCP